MHFLCKTLKELNWGQQAAAVTASCGCGCGYGGYCYGVVVLNLFIIVLCGFVYFFNVWGCVCVGFVLYGCVRLM